MGGGGWGIVFQAGYHPRKRTFKTHLSMYFPGMEIDPKYAFLHVFFLICPSCHLQNLWTWPKTHTLFFLILHVFAPLNDAHTYVSWSWKTTLITWIFLQGWYSTSNTSAPPPASINWSFIGMTNGITTEHPLYFIMFPFKFYTDLVMTPGHKLLSYPDVLPQSSTPT